MRQIKQRKGFALILVLALIPLIGMASLVLNANSRILLTQSRRLALKTHAHMACESGIAWIENQNKQTLTNSSPFVLQIDHKDKTITCNIEMISQTDKQSVFNITGCAKDKRFSNEYHYKHISKY
ncbi:MAG: hypothetical protein KAS23_10725 [Anaerohalosphaera sp.]|nr:hypothetical protein [Anaerohalosphaera sp.]